MNGSWGTRARGEGAALVLEGDCPIRRARAGLDAIPLRYTSDGMLCTNREKALMMKLVAAPGVSISSVVNEEAASTKYSDAALILVV